MEHNNYDPNELLLSPSIEVTKEILGLPSDFELDIAPTPCGMKPSSQISSNSPPQSITTLFDELPNDDPFCNIDINGFELKSPIFDELQPILINTDAPSLISDLISNTSFGFDDDGDKLRIIAQPKAYYRERYSCETDPKKNRAQRYIRADDGNAKYEYPTVQIPEKWRDSKRQIFIRVTPITIQNKNAPGHCVHPYEIDTQENNVIKDPQNNSLYFRINENEFITGEKSFHISRKKMIQSQLRNYGPFRLFGSGQPDIDRLKNPQDAKQKIGIYQLWKSQFVFTMAERVNNNLLPIPRLETSVISQIMIDEAADGRTINHSNATSIDNIKCIPQKGDWNGGDEVLIIMPTPIKRKVYSISFDFGQHGQCVINEISYIDTKTILFRTPSCPLLPGDSNVKISIFIQENNLLYNPIEFYYITPMKITTNLCPRCQGNGMNNYISNKRRCNYDQLFETDCGDSLISQMNQLSIEKKPNEKHSRISSDEKYAKFEKYLNQLKDALATYVRTNDPSKLFRRTRILLTKFDTNSSPLVDAIQHGHIELASVLIEQVIDMSSPNPLLEKRNDNDETPLLISAKYNHEKLIETILKRRPELTEQKDKDENNIFHLLANLNEDKGFETLKNLFTIISNPSKLNLLKQPNKNDQLPLDIAQSHGNTQCIDLFKSITE